MKKLLQSRLYFSLIAVIGFLSCEKTGLMTTLPDHEEVPVNKVPVANAGIDMNTTLPKDSVLLDATASIDPDGSITDYAWSKIAGPQSFFIKDSAAAKTVAKNLVEGRYLFELSVTDNGGLTAKDTVEVTVYAAISSGCAGNTRPQTNASWTQIGTLSVARVPCVAAAGNKIVFAGGPFLGSNGYYYNSSAVDVYDVNTKGWSRANLSKEREGIAAVSCGNKIFFAGGGFWEWAFSNIDIYDASNNVWSTASLSIARSYLTAATVGNKVFFAGGFTDGWIPSSHVDIYDLSTNTWSETELSRPRYNLTAVTVGDKIYFAGGYEQDGYSKQVDIFDNTTGSWSTSSLRNLSGFISGVALGNYIYWAGINQQNTGAVEIWNTINGSVTSDCLTYPRSSPTSVTKNNDVVFFSSADWNNELDLIGHLRNQFDIYNAVTGQWSVGILPYGMVAPGIISANNSIYVGGGRTGSYSCSDKVYVLSWD